MTAPAPVLRNPPETSAARRNRKPRRRAWRGLATFTAFAVSQAGTALGVSPPPVEASHAMVVTSQHLATEIGLDILKQGGNAVDAAVAVGYALAVVEPCCGNVGGGGFMIIHLANGTERFIDFREKAPLGATAAMYLDARGHIAADSSRIGYRAVAVPGTVMGLQTALERYGSFDRARVMEPAIELANKGFVLSRGDTDYLEANIAGLLKNPNVAAVFTRDGQPLRPGDMLIQTDLASTLRAIASDGAGAFYGGAIADTIVAASQEGGGILSKQDFLGYSAPEDQPLTCGYRGYRIATAPPPSSGGVVLCEVLNIVEAYDLNEMGFHSAAAIHVMVEAMRRAFADRNALGDPAFTANPVERLISKDYAAQLRAKIDPQVSTRSQRIVAGAREGSETTHYSIVDAAGNAVSVTFTINGPFGAKVIAGHTGFFLNDEMDDFTIKPGAANMYGLVQGDLNAIAPGKRPLSSMSPTVVTKGGHVVLVLGSPGGSRIITTTLETILNVVDHGMTIQEAVDAPRIHHQWQPDEIDVEPGAVSADTALKLTQMGYKIVEQKPWGAAEAIFMPPLGTGPGAATPALGIDAVSAGSRPGWIYGARDDRRPAPRLATERDWSGLNWNCPPRREWPREPGWPDGARWP